MLVALPFNFVLPLLAGLLHDWGGNYDATFVYQILMFVIAFAMLQYVIRSGAFGAADERPVSDPASQRS